LRDLDWITIPGAIAVVNCVCCGRYPQTHQASFVSSRPRGCLKRGLATGCNDRSASGDEELPYVRLVEYLGLRSSRGTIDGSLVVNLGAAVAAGSRGMPTLVECASA